MWLQDFSYYFSVTGDEGGLFSVEFNFCPGAAPGRRLSPAQEKDAVREDFSAVDALLEKTMPTGVFGGKTKKTPTLSDSPAGSQVGFIYRNRLTHTAKLEYHLHKTNRQVPATVQLRLTLGHRMNLSFFEKSWPCRVCRPAKKRSAACAGCVRCWKPRDGTTLTR